MASYLVPSTFAAFVWWFSTGAVLLLVGLPARFDLLRVAVATGSLVAALFGLAASGGDSSVAGAYLAFSCTILLWGAQEIAFLAGWLTGPRAEPCPPGVRGWRRLGFALQAILYHELALLACGAAVAWLTWGAANPVGPWTFAALWVLRQSAKINLFLGVPVTNDELMPAPVRFLKSYFRRQPVGAFFPLSVTLAIAALVMMIQRIVEVAVTPFETASLTLVAALFALGVVEHWFMLLPLPALTLWGWGMRSQFPEGTTMEQGPDPNATVAPQLAVISTGGNETARARPVGARQRLEDEFRQRFLEQHPRSELVTALGRGAEPAATVNGRTT